ncbi:hypothetical protein ACVIEM_003320 [Rhizobium leguminosarum]
MTFIGGIDAIEYRLAPIASHLKNDVKAIGIGWHVGQRFTYFFDGDVAQMLPDLDPVMDFPAVYTGMGFVSQHMSAEN